MSMLKFVKITEQGIGKPDWAAILKRKTTMENEEKTKINWLQFIEKHKLVRLCSSNTTLNTDRHYITTCMLYEGEAVAYTIWAEPENWYVMLNSYVFEVSKNLRDILQMTLEEIVTLTYLYMKITTSKKHKHGKNRNFRD